MRIILLCTAFIFLLLPGAVHSEVSECPRSIVSVTLASDEILLDIVEDRSRISGVTYLANDASISNVVEKSQGITKIHANLEQIVQLDPDLVITADYLGSDFITLLKSAGLPVMVMEEVDDIQSVKMNIREIGKKVCEQENASGIISRMEKDIEAIRNKNKPGDKVPEVLFYSAPGFTAGPHSIINQLIGIAGGKNAFQAETLVRSTKISLEYIVEIDPDIIILSNFSPSDPNFEEKFLKNSAIKQTKAYKNDRIHILDGRYIISASHYIVNGVKKLSELIHGGS